MVNTAIQYVQVVCNRVRVICVGDVLGFLAQNVFLRNLSIVFKDQNVGFVFCTPTASHAKFESALIDH